MHEMIPGQWYFVACTMGGRDWTYVAKFVKPSGLDGGVFSDVVWVVYVSSDGDGRAGLCEAGSAERRSARAKRLRPGRLLHVPCAQCWEADPWTD